MRRIRILASRGAQLMNINVNELVRIALKGRNAEPNINDEFKASSMLARLSDDFKPLVMAAKNEKEKLDMGKSGFFQDTKFDHLNSQNEASLYTKNWKERQKTQSIARVVKNLGENRNNEDVM